MKCVTLLTILAIAFLALTFVAAQDECMEQCEQEGEECQSGCPGQCSGSSDPSCAFSCVTACTNQVASCAQGCQNAMKKVHHSTKKIHHIKHAAKKHAPKPVAVTPAPSLTNPHHHTKSISNTTATFATYDYQSSGVTDCSKGQIDYSKLLQTGQCRNKGNQSLQVLCDSNGGYRVTYSQQNCQGDISFIKSQALGCATGLFGVGSSDYQCYQPELGPLPPWSIWPPPQMMLTTYCGYDTENQVCPGLVEPQECFGRLYPVNECVPTQVYDSSAMVEYFCTQDSLWRGVASYNDTVCSSTSLTSIQLTSNSCQNGAGSGTLPDCT